jgi:hypothetical protein
MQRGLSVSLIVLCASIPLAVGPVRAQNSFLHPTVAAGSAAVAEHQQLADHYRAEARECHARLLKQQSLVNYWGRKLWIESRSKLPNPYSSAQTLVVVYRAREERWWRLAAEQDRIVKQLHKP